jgi:hypothetical protein
MMSEENLLASMHLREKQELLDSVFDCMRKPWLIRLTHSNREELEAKQTLFCRLSRVPRLLLPLLLFLRLWLTCVFKGRFTTV